ncbi:hypothetical protein GO988_05315 [Hymenobacter sp. HMF4947]|uniref:Uncharacterized protein n=1 Tax=Hymenobacter ginkgonis TaxID=2682976 RepID=A0A7K1TBF4_9BACT|nr:hypothetical protein [Hymenobacter ginkgonis]MVN75740.1 hypothetical protein [Hymenobacter ginkgonis]
MKYLATLLFALSLLPALAQQRFTTRNLLLPKELEFYDNQFSGLAVSKDKLLLMTECRLQDNAEAKLYAIKLTDLDRQLTDSTYVLPYQKLRLPNLPVLRAKIDALGQRYEGLEALLIDKDVVYLSVETATPSANCYLLKGRLHAATIDLDTAFLVPLTKPLAADGSHIYNAGFEALAKSHKQLFAFFEFNYFPAKNYAYAFERPPLRSTSTATKVLFEKLPFRITDVTATGSNHFTAINYFFKGEGEDAVYRTPTADVGNAHLIADKGVFKNYCRLITIEFKGDSFSWKPVWEFPEQYRGYNWEGIAAYKQGYFIINDKYTPTRPYRSTLLYLQQAN